jgi:xylulokinase
VALTVGLDIGTTSVKAVLADDDGVVVARARVPHAIGVPVPGAFEHDVDVAWRAGVLAALGEVAAVAAGPIVGVNVVAMVPSLGAVDGEGRGLGPGLLYGDVRGAARERDVTAAGDPGELLAFLGWLADACPGAAGFWPAQAAANHALTGRGAIDSTTAITAHPLHDFTGWDAELCAAAGVRPEQLPEVVGGTAPVGVVLEGRPAAGAAVGGGGIDALAEQLVAGADATGDVLAILGTTLITWGVVDDWQEVPGLWTIPHTAPGKVMVGGPSNAGGLFLDRVGRWLGPADGDHVDPGDVPVWLPYLRGERTPLHRTDIRASLHGLGLTHGAGHLRRAAHEASAFVLRHHLDLGAAAGVAPRRIVATGGGTRSEPWVQALADATGLPVDVVAVPEGAALGSAFLARCTAGLESTMTDASRWARTARTVDPRPDWVEPMEGRYQTFRSLTAAL